MENIFNESKRFIPGGVNSPVRAYNDFDIDPPIIKSGEGQYIYDEEGKKFTDYVLSYGPMILGHCNEKVVKAIEETSKNAIAFGAPTKLELQVAKIICETLEQKLQ